MPGECVIAIQGGGVFGLSLLGQAKAILEDMKYIPLGFSGTSAGAIVATLLWGGLSPSMIEREIVQLASAGQLASLLGPFEEGIDPSSLTSLKEEATAVATGLRDASIFGLLPTLARGWRLRVKVKPAIEARGLFSGQRLEEWIEHCLRLSPNLPDHLRKKPGPLTFGDYQDLLASDPVHYFRPPLVLTATNLSYGRLDLIRSFDVKSQSIPVAAAARASGTFPMAIRPREIPEAFPDGGTYVDGGVVANFPLWVFSQAMRDDLEQHPQYGWLAYRPWIRIGLRVVDHQQVNPTDSPVEFVSALGAMLARGTRSQLEDMLTENLPRQTVIPQPSTSTEGPPSVLDLDVIDGKRATRMIELGRQWATTRIEQVGKPRIYEHDAGKEVEFELKELVDRCTAVLFPGYSGPPKFRANVFLIQGAGLTLAHAFNSPPGALGMHFPTTRSGMAGISFTHRRPYICNREMTRKLRKENPALYRQLFALNDEPPEAAPIGPLPSWLLSTPMLDPAEARIARWRPASPTQTHESYASFPWSPPAVPVPVIGVLNLDGLWTYGETGIDQNPNKQWEDQRIRVIIDLAEIAAVRVSLRVSWRSKEEGRRV